LLISEQSQARFTSQSFIITLPHVIDISKITTLSTGDFRRVSGGLCNTIYPSSAIRRIIVEKCDEVLHHPRLSKQPRNHCFWASALLISWLVG
jgi:hypothetical protein